MKHAPTLWTLPASLLWLPTGANAFILAEAVQFWWERAYGTANTAQGDFAIAMHILMFSTPIAICFLIGITVLAVLRTRVPRDAEAIVTRGPAVLALANVIAPVLLHFSLRWAS
jgi:hypothetical protein